MTGEESTAPTQMDRIEILLRDILMELRKNAQNREKALREYFPK